MTYTVAQLAEMCRQHESGFYPDASTDENGQSLVLSIVNEAQATIAQKCELYDETTIVLPLVAGQRDYTWDQDVFRINAALYFENASYSRPILETSIDEQDKTFRGWRTLAAAPPVRYYLYGTKVGFVQAPSLTTPILPGPVVGYPRVEFKVVKPTRFSSLTDALPTMLPNLDAYVYQTLLRWALRQGPDMIALYAPLAANALNDLARFVFARTRRKNSRIMPSVMRIGG